MRIKRVRRVASAAAMLAAVLIAGSAAITPAHTKRFGTGLSASFQESPGSTPNRVGGTFSGLISSRKAACLRNRRVEFAYVDSKTGLVHNLQDTRTNANGGFSHTVPDGRIRDPETYRVKVHKRTATQNRRHLHRCKAKLISFGA